MQRAKDGFTLTELLVAVIIVTILVTLAVPQYEKLIERSHLGEAQSILTSLQEAKLFAMDKMEINEYGEDENGNTLSTPLPGLEHLNVSFASGSTGKSFNTKYFTYSLQPGGTNVDVNPNGVCAVRRGGDTIGTIFYFYRPSGVNTSNFWCNGAFCESVYGLDNTPNIECSQN